MNFTRIDFDFSLNAGLLCAFFIIIFLAFGLVKTFLTATAPPAIKSLVFKPAKVLFENTINLENKLKGDK